MRYKTHFMDLKTKSLFHLNLLTFASIQVLLFALFPFFSEILHISLSKIALSFSIGSLLFLWGSPFWSKLSDKIGRPPVLAISTGGLFVSCAILAFLVSNPSSFSPLHVLILFILGRFIYGALASGIVPVVQAGQSDFLKEETHLKAAYGHTLSLTLGRILGPILLILNSDIHFLLWALTSWTFVLFAANLFISKKTPLLNSPPETLSKWRDILGEIQFPLLITVFFTTFIGLLHSSLGGTIQRTFLLGGEASSELMAKLLLMGSVLMGIIQILGKKYSSQNWKGPILLGVTSLFIGSCFFLLMTSQPMIWVAIAFISAGIALIQPSNIAMVHQTGKREIGKKFGLLASGNTIGYALGGTLAALFMKLPGNYPPLLLTLILFFIIAINIKQAYR